MCTSSNYNLINPRIGRYTEANIQHIIKLFCSIKNVYFNTACWLILIPLGSYHYSEVEQKACHDQIKLIFLL